jgi:hypothetical protein
MDPVISRKCIEYEKKPNLETIIDFQEQEIFSLREQLANQELLSLTSVFSQPERMNDFIKPIPTRCRITIDDYERENMQLIKRNTELEHSARYWIQLNSLKNIDVVDLIESLRAREQRLVSLIEFYQSQTRERDL